VAVLADPARRSTLRVAGRAAVEERYAWDPIVRSFVTLVDAQVGARARG
jgi:hypothetical protein